MQGQKRNLALFNIPYNRFELTNSPYPSYSQFQLNMRRKAEIFKYNSSQQNTKANGLTKKQKYAYLSSNISVGGISQHRINQTDAPNGVCLPDQLKPTSTTACGVPGAPMMLQYDPAVPLYNYGNYKENRTYAIIYKENTVIYSQYTKNIVEYIVADLDYVYPDASLSYQTYTTQLGSIIINSTNENTYNFNISTPIAIWFKGSVNSGYDINGNRIVKPAILSTDHLDFRITGVELQIYYNDTLAFPLNGGPTLTHTFTDCSFNLSTAVGGFYGVQYVGMLNINNLILRTSPNSIYSLRIVTNYTYNNTTAYKLDYTKTGIYANLQSRTDSMFVDNCVLSSVPPTDFNGGGFTHFFYTQ
jgi:hypothetical protein